MIFSPKNRDDIIRYFRGTYVKFKERGDELFYIEAVNEMRVTGKHESGVPFTIYLDEDTPFEVDYLLPHKSFFQHGQHAVQLQRIPAQQYFRGLCGHNTQFSYLAGGTAPKNLQIGFDILKQFVSKQKFYNIQGALTAQELSTCVLTSRMMFNRANRQIYMDFTPIAKVIPAKGSIVMIRPVFYDEVAEFLKNTGEKFSLEKYPPPHVPQKVRTKAMLQDMGVKFDLEAQ